MRNFCCALALVLVNSLALAATLTWQDTSSGLGQESVFVVERKLMPNGAYAEVGRTGPDVKTWHDPNATPGSTYSWKVKAENAAGSSAFSNEVTLLIPPVVVVPPAAINCGPVLAMNFNEMAGTSAIDSSGQKNNGQVVGPTWTAQGKYGGALSFDGVDDVVTVPDANSLDAATGATMSSWVYPTSVSGWRTVLLKEQPGGMPYSIYASDGAKPTTVMFVGGVKKYTNGVAALPLNTWSHVAATYDSTQFRLFVNGVIVAQSAWTGLIGVSSGVLRIGGNAVWGNEFFQGRIDEVRVYGRALSPPEIKADMATLIP